MFAYCNNNSANYLDTLGSRCVAIKPLGGGAKQNLPSPDNTISTAEKITILLAETGYAVMDGIEAEFGVGMGFGGTARVSVFGLPVSADLFITTKLALVIDDGMIDIRSISSFGAGLPLADYFGVDTVKGVSHSLFDPKCTCHINSSWKDMVMCSANEPFFDTSPSIGASAGGYFVIGGEFAIGYDLQAFAESAMRAYESIF